MDRNHFFDGLVKLRVELRLNRPRINFPDDLAQQFLTALAKPRPGSPVDISESPFAIELIVQIGNALEDVVDFPVRIPQSRQRLIALAHGFASLKFMQAGIVEGNRCLIGERGQLPLFFSGEWRIADYGQKTVERTVRHDWHGYQLFSRDPILRWRDRSRIVDSSMRPAKFEMFVAGRHGPL